MPSSKLRFMLAEGLTRLPMGELRRWADRELARDKPREVQLHLDYLTPDLGRFAPLTFQRYASDVGGRKVLMGASQIDEQYVFWLDGAPDVPAPVRVYDLQVIRDAVLKLSEDPAWPTLIHHM